MPKLGLWAPQASDRLSGRGAIRRTHMSTSKTLTDLASALLSGSVRVVDLSAPLGPDPPVIFLPPEIAKNTPPVKVHQISKYDSDGPYWAWNWLQPGEATGT